MQWQWLPEQILYTGRELHSHWIAETAGLDGDAIIGFVGPCNVPVEHLVDLEDARRGVGISAAQMLHFVAEHFDTDLATAVLRQRLLVCLTAEILSAASVSQLHRDGDDLFVGERKLSVSIATTSPVSALIHLGLNIDPAGAPVPAVGLTELGVPAPALAQQVMAAYAGELRSCQAACAKVREVP